MENITQVKAVIR